MRPSVALSASLTLSILASASAGAGAACAQRREVGHHGPALNWVRLPGAEACVGPVELAARVEERLGRSIFVRAPDAIVVIEGQVSPLSPERSGFGARIRVSDPEGTVYGEREVSVAGDDCAHLGEAAALVIAITLRDQARGGGIPLPAEIAAAFDALFAEDSSELDPNDLPASSPPQATASEPAAAEPGPTAAAPPRPQPASAGGAGSAHLGLGAGLMAATGWQPDDTLGIAGRARLALDGLFELALLVQVGFAREQRVEDDSGRLRFRALMLALSGCPPALRAFSGELALCAHVGLGRIDARGRDFQDENFSVHPSFVELGPEARLRLRLAGPLYLQLATRVPLRPSRPRFAYTRSDGQGIDVFRVAAVGFEGELGLEVALF